MALRLQRFGVARIRPLAGGIEAWHALGLPVTPRIQRAAETTPEPAAGPAR